MALAIKEAKRSASWLRMALIGPSGSGKTFTGLGTLSEMKKLAGGTDKILCIDSENGSASKYAKGGRGGFGFDFDVLELDDDFALQTYIDAIELAVNEGYRYLLIDSLTHAWAGPGGALEEVDRKAAASRSGNSFTAWRDVTPIHNRLFQVITRYPGHVVATIRSKVGYDLVDDGKGKKIPVKIGLQPIQREGVEYEFDVVGELDQENTMRITKSRCGELRGETQPRPGVKLAKTLHEWLSDGDPLAPAPAKAATATTTAKSGNGNGAHNGSMADPTLAGLTRDQLLARLPHRAGAFFLSLGKPAPSTLADDALRSAVAWLERPAGQTVYTGWLRLQEPATTTATETSTSTATESPSSPPGPAPGVSPDGGGEGILPTADREPSAEDLRAMRTQIRRGRGAMGDDDFAALCERAGTTAYDWVDAHPAVLETLAMDVERLARKAG